MRSHRRIIVCIYKGKIEKETKLLAYKELIDWVLENAKSFHVIKVNTDEKHGSCTVTYQFIRKPAKNRCLKKRL